MNLLDVVRSLHSQDDALTIYVKEPWSEASASLVLQEPDSGGAPEEATQRGFVYFLEVSIAREFLEDWVRGLAVEPTPEAKCARLIQYAATDA